MRIGASFQSAVADGAATSHHPGLAYRPDIDGLRAVAILAVLFYHAQMPFFSGGYIGVDVFFVISGYLITHIILRDCAGANFSLLGFYERRVRRIVPALVPVLVFVIVAAAVWLLPYEVKQASRSVLSALTFTANFEFWRQSGYFVPSARFTPLLHTWSLAIEEQFYLFYPLPLIFLAKRSKRTLGISLGCLFMGSLAMSLWATRYHEDAAYYFTPSRAWELLMGCLLVLCPVRVGMPRWLREVMSLSGIAAILYSVMTFSSNVRMYFPAPAALLPCLGGALLIHAGSLGPSLVTRALSWRPVVAVGLLSYSLYLWHWPFFVFAHIWHIWAFGVPVDRSVRVLLILLSLVVAAISWKWIEQPIRNRKVLVMRKPLFAAAGACAACIGVVALFGLMSGWAGRVKPEAAQIAEIAGYRQRPIATELFGPKTCHVTHIRSYDAGICFHPQVGVSNILLWGDSHAGHFSRILSQFLQRNNGHLLQATYAACKPFLNKAPTISDECLQFNRMVAKVAADMPIDVAVISAQWAMGGAFAKDPVGRAQWFAEIGRTVKLFQDRHIPVILIGQSPRYLVPLPFLLSRAVEEGRPLGPTADKYLDPRVFAWEPRMKAMFGNMPGVTYVSVLDDMCPEGHCSPFAKGNVPMFFDTEHYTLEGAQMVFDVALDKALRSAMRRPPP